METRTDYIKKAIEEQKEYLSIDTITAAASDEYYNAIEKLMKVGGEISQAVYDSLTEYQQFHFNKHYNFRGDKII